jgi:hypothetical protein
MADNVEEKVRKVLLDSLEKMPGVIRSALQKPKISATSTLKWTELACRLFRGPIDRQATELDLRVASEAREILKDAVPLLKRIRDGSASERLKRKAEKYLQIIEREISRRENGGR